MKAPLNRLFILLFTLIYSCIAYTNEPVFYNPTDLLKEYIYDGDDIHLGRITNVKWDYNDSLELNKITVKFTRYSSDTSDTRLYTYTVDNFRYKDGFPVSADVYNSYYDKFGRVKYSFDDNSCSFDCNSLIFEEGIVKVDIKLISNDSIIYRFDYKKHRIDSVSFARRIAYYIKDNYMNRHDSIIGNDGFRFEQFDVYENIKYPLMLQYIGVPDLINIKPGLFLWGSNAIEEIFPSVYGYRDEQYDYEYDYDVDSRNRIIHIITRAIRNSNFKLTATLKYLHE